MWYIAFFCFPFRKGGGGNLSSVSVAAAAAIFSVISNAATLICLFPLWLVLGSRFIGCYRQLTLFIAFFFLNKRIVGGEYGGKIKSDLAEGSFPRTLPIDVQYSVSDLLCSLSLIKCNRSPSAREQRKKHPALKTRSCWNPAAAACQTLDFHFSAPPGPFFPSLLCRAHFGQLVWKSFVGVQL